MRFKGRTHAGKFSAAVEVGRIVAAVPGIDRARLCEALPQALRKHANVGAFLDAVECCAAHVADMAADVTGVTPATLRDELVGVETAAHAMQNALQPLAHASAAFETLSVQFAYLALRAHERGAPTAGRPVVPALPAEVPELPVLLARIHADLQTLRDACEYTADRIANPLRSTPKYYERWVVELIALEYRHHFGKLPPKRGLFADALIEHVAQAMGMTIGHYVVGEVVAAMK